MRQPLALSLTHSLFHVSIRCSTVATDVDAVSTAAVYYNGGHNTEDESQPRTSLTSQHTQQQQLRFVAAAATAFVGDISDECEMLARGRLSVRSAWPPSAWLLTDHKPLNALFERHQSTATVHVVGHR